MANDDVLLMMMMMMMMLLMMLAMMKSRYIRVVVVAIIISTRLASFSFLDDFFGFYLECNEIWVRIQVEIANRKKEEKKEKWHLRICCLFICFLYVVGLLFAQLFLTFACCCRGLFC